MWKINSVESSKTALFIRDEVQHKVYQLLTRCEQFPLGRWLVAQSRRRAGHRGRSVSSGRG